LELFWTEPKFYVPWGDVLRICLSPFIIIVMIWVILGTIVDDPGQPKYSLDIPHRLINVVVLYDIGPTYSGTTFIL